VAENRRDFLKRAGGTTAALGLPVLGAASVSAQPGTEDRPAAGRRRRSGSGLFLELTGQPAGPVGSESSGGFAFGQVVSELPGSDRVVRKHLAGVDYADITLAAGPGLSPTLYQWMQQMLLGTRKDGALVTVDYARRRRRELQFVQALIREVVFPAVDVTSREPIAMSVKIAPEFTRDVAGSGQPVDWPAGRAPRWLASDFRLSIDGLEDATRQALRVEALPLRAVIQDDTVGEQRKYEQGVTNLDVPNLVFTLPDAEADSLLEWTDSFLVHGNCSQDQEKNGTLEYLSEQGTVLFTLRFGQLGIFRLAPEREEGVHRLKAEMYCETLAFEFQNS
jgi:hypothetical protein